MPVKVRCQCHAAGKCCLFTVRVFKYSRCKRINFFFRKAGDCSYLRWFITQNTQDQAGIVNTKIIGATAKGISSHTDILRVIIRSDVGRLHIAHISNGPIFNLFSDRSNVRAVLVCKCFHQVYMIFFCSFKHFFCLCFCRCKRLFTEHMFAAFKSPNRPFIVHGIGKRDINSLYFWICK